MSYFETENEEYYQEDRYEPVRGYLEGILEAMYESGDVDDLEAMVDELCHHFNVPMCVGDLKIKKKEEKKSMLQEYLETQRVAIDEMNAKREENNV